ncbi:MAG: single-stranded-DNA-specific exonuclease RecJ [Phycisphaerales bacterium JB039]
MTQFASKQASVRGVCRRWRLPEPVEVPPGLAVEPVVARVLAARGLVDPKTLEEFLAPSLLGLADPSLIPDLDRAAGRLHDAARAGESIVIYGDYDVDGVTATAILFHMLRAVAPEAPLSTYVPHRVEEGYGLNGAAIRSLAEGGARVIVSVDCGVTAVAEAQLARALGVDLIITDHHNPPSAMEDLPPAWAVVHPRRPDSTYPFGELCGAGVAYKLAWRIATIASGSDRVRDDLRARLINLLALAALGTIADVVPLVGENRILARFGLARIKTSPLIGLRALVRASNLDGEEIDSERAGFLLAPRLNACGRMSHAADAVEMFTTADEARAAQIAGDLNRLNSRRQATERRMVEQACAMAEAAGMTGPEQRAIVLAHPEWAPGVVGIAASRLVDRYGRPTILMQAREDVCAGSGRSIDGFNLHAALSEVADTLAGFGGHDMAAGVRVAPERLGEFSDRFMEVAGSRLTAEDLTPACRVDTDALLGELSVAAARQLASLAPFGRGNPSARIRLTGLRLAAAPERFGRTGDHLSLRITDGARQMRCVGWKWAAQAPEMSRGTGVELVVSPKLSSWNGTERVEPTLVDLRVIA